MSPLWKGAAAGLVGGLAGAWAKSKTEPVLQVVGEDFFPPTYDEKQLPGADISGHPERMPPALLVARLTGGRISQTQTLAAQSRIHYVFGTGAGVAYGVLAEVAPVVGIGYGLPAALALWAGTHGTMLPALGLQARPADLPTSAHVWEVGSHLVFGLTADLVRRAVRRAL
ncbi:MAG: DUF1440 domain-containing protein [Bacteroidota bacterium]